MRAHIQEHRPTRFWEKRARRSMVSALGLSYCSPCLAGTPKFSNRGRQRSHRGAQVPRCTSLPWACRAALSACSTQWGRSGSALLPSAIKQPAVEHRPGPPPPSSCHARPGPWTTVTESRQGWGPARDPHLRKGWPLCQLWCFAAAPALSQANRIGGIPWLDDAYSPNAQLSPCKAHSWCLAMPVCQNPRPPSRIPGL